MSSLLTKPFERIAIVNRGEPAMRLIRAVREWNCSGRPPLKTIALYTEPDREALFVREADVAFCLGPALWEDPEDLDEAGRPRRKNRYLDYERLWEALTRTRADAAWVGWGFVSEHAAFAELCAEMGVCFIGPPPEAMRRLGDKIAAKQLAEKAGVPVAPWSGGPVATLDEARAHAARIGYPLLVKATAGGGGRGIRFVSSPEQLAPAFESAAAEARKSFGDPTLFLEARVERPRHVEVQVLADTHGTIWPAGIRDCTVQRSNQKVIEEAPCPGLSPALERDLKDAAVRLARAAGYVNAGTVEFLLEPERARFHFMEMNTRLQVEHPVTEATTGLDLVRLQVAIAQGERLPGEPPATRGHAIEVRLCAEDPERSFAPSPGRMACFRPAFGPGVRTDSGVLEGDPIPVEFDSMIAKIIAHGETREEARARLARALLESLAVVEGGTTNRAFLLRLLSHPDFVTAGIDTGWLDRLMHAGFAAEPAPNAAAALLAVAIQLHERQLEEEELNFFASAARGRPALPAQQRRPIELRLGGVAYEFRVSTLEPGVFRVDIDGSRLDVRLEHDGPYELRLCYDTTAGVCRHRVVSVPSGSDHLVEVDGLFTRISRDPGGLLRAPAPGLVLGIDVTEGDLVRAGDRLLALEAMKMETPVTAPFEGRIRQLLTAPSTQVAAGDPLLVLEPLAPADGHPERAAARVAFPHEDPASEVTAGRAFRTTLRELRRLMLGFDIGDERVNELLTRFTELLPEEPAPAVAGERDSVQAQPPGFEGVRELLALYLDLESLFSKRYRAGSAPASRPSQERSFQLYLREFRAEGRGLPEDFLAALRVALARYHVPSLAESSRLRDALVWIHRSHQNVALKNRVVVTILQRCLDRPAWSRAAATAGFSELLERLVTLTQETSPSVCESAQQARYELFEGRALDARRRKALARVDEVLEQLGAQPDAADRAARMAEIVETPYALTAHLAPRLGWAPPAMATLLLETLERRFWRPQDLVEARPLVVRGRPLLLSRTADPGTTVFATHGALAEVATSLAALREAGDGLGAQEQAHVDLVLAAPAEGSDEERMATLLTEALSRAELGPHIARLCAITCDASSRVRYFTFLRRGGRWEEEELLRGFHPATGERLELWRMRNFKIRRVSTSEDLHLFHARARTNERDERLFALAEVRELRPVRDATGALVSLPEYEHALLEAFHAIREQQARRDARQRLHWNRITVYVRPPLRVRREELLELTRRLYPSTLHLGLEKIAVRALLAEDASQKPRDTVLSFSDRTGHKLGLSVAEPHREPLKALDDYSLKLIRARQRRITYPYEIVKTLAPNEASADFTAGEFEEHDLAQQPDGSWKLVPVTGRPYGENTANIVVGVIRNFTVKYPEGLTRVLVLGDGTREMGALAEPECRRLIAALDLAEQMKVPLEWFPVSSGAKIAMDSGTENLDWTAAVLRRIVQFTQAGGEINVVVDGINVGAQSYWNAEATMLMHTRGCLIMTPRGTMLLTGKRALDYSGGISADDNLGIGGFERIMGPNGQAHYHAHDLGEACRILLRYYDHTYVPPGERSPRRRRTQDAPTRNICETPYRAGDGFGVIGDLWNDTVNPGRKKSFDIRALMGSVVDKDCKPLERWAQMRDAGVAVVWDAHLGGWPASVIGIESQPLPRLGYVPSDGPETWSGGTLFPMASKKVARAINAASNNRPVVVLANLSGFDGSPESLRRLQLEYGAEIGRAVVNFKGPLVFCVIARYHGGAYVVFSKTLNPSLKVLALTGSYASVIGGAPAAAVVFPEEARALTLKDPRVVEMRARLRAHRSPGPELTQEFDDLFAKVHTEKLRQIAEQFDSVHTVQRALEVGSLDGIIEPAQLRPAVIAAIEAGLGVVARPRPRAPAVA